MWRTPGGPLASPGLEGFASGTRFLLHFPVHAARSLRRDPRGWGRVEAQCVFSGRCAGEGCVDLGPNCSRLSTPRCPPLVSEVVSVKIKPLKLWRVCVSVKTPRLPEDRRRPPRGPCAPPGPGRAGRRTRPWRQFRLRIRQWPADPRVPIAVPIATGRARTLIGHVRQSCAQRFDASERATYAAANWSARSHVTAAGAG